MRVNTAALIPACQGCGYSHGACQAMSIKARLYKSASGGWTTERSPRGPSGRDADAPRAAGNKRPVPRVPGEGQL